ncbi:MAG: LytS/YhcK type 5TM receptor domain-containing protein [Methanocorpusculum sp.]|nr:LytS/YhcK type 5TM receptor domain-containing protein [Methanocorpusculum sp.]
MDQTLSIVIFLIVNIVIAAVLAFIFGKTGILSEDSKKISKWLKYVIGIAAFGAASVIGTAAGTTFNGVTVNSRDFGPVAGGLWFGAVIGIGAGIIGAAFRLTTGGVTLIPCTIATLLAGIIAALVYVWFKKSGKQMTVLISVIVAVIVEIIHLILTALIAENGVAIVLGPAGIGTLISSPLIVLIFSVVYRLSAKKSAD